MNWVKNRVRERTSLDGVLFIGGGLFILFITPLAKYIAMGAIAWGVWTLLKKG